MEESSGRAKTQLAFGILSRQTLRASELTSTHVIFQPTSASIFDHRPPSQPTSRASPGGPARDRASSIIRASNLVTYLPHRDSAALSQNVSEPGVVIDFPVYGY